MCIVSVIIVTYFLFYTVYLMLPRFY